MGEIPRNLQPLLDGDIIKYEIGFAAETGWKAMTRSQEYPPWPFVQSMLEDRIRIIKNNCFTNKDPIIYITEGKTFRYDIAKRKPYKAQRKESKPFHFNNLHVYMRDILKARIITGIEADDAMAIDHTASNLTTILCSRDKDLKQVPGYFYSWELGRQPSWGPELITQAGSLMLSPDNKKLTGTGLSWFYAQVLTGDVTDNIPGCPNIGPAKAYEMLNEKSSEEQLEAVMKAYQEHYGLFIRNGENVAQELIDNPFLIADWETELTEQGRLCWLLRKPDQEWELGVVD